MKPVLVLYAAREGETRRIAEHVAQHLTLQGLVTRIEDVGEFDGPIEPDQYHGVVLAASVHLGRHACEMIRFVRAHRQELGRLPTAFLSVSLAAAAAEDSRQSGARHPVAMTEIERATLSFLDRTGFRPTLILPVAGALLYTQYGRLVRFVMQRITEDAGLDVDTTGDFEYTAWARLDRFVDAFLQLRSTSSVAPSAATYA